MKREILIILLILIVLALSIFAIFFFQKWKADYVYKARYTLAFQDNVPFDRKIPGVVITTNEVIPVSDVNTQFDEWLIITRVNEGKEPTSNIRSFTYITYVKLDLFKIDAQNVQVERMDGSIENDEVLKKYMQGEISFSLGDYFFIYQHLPNNK